MSALHDAVEEYLSIRRALGSPIPTAATQLRRFADLLEREGADCVTIPRALRWAQQSTRAQPATWADRLGVVRRFAAWRSLADPPCVRLVVAFNFIHGRAAAQSDAAGVRSSWLVLLSMEDRERGQ